MPARKPKKPAEKPVAAAPKNPATAAHERDADAVKAPVAASKPAAKPKDMDPNLEAKRSGPPASTVEPKPLADPDAGFEKPTEQFDRDAEAPSPERYQEIEADLKDPTFDPEGHERLKLAEESLRHGGAAPYPPTSDVDERGMPTMPERKSERDA